MRNPKYHIYLTHSERRTVINSLIDLRNKSEFVHLTSDLLFLRIFQSPFISKPCHNIHYINRIL